MEDIRDVIRNFLKEFAHDCEPYCDIDKNEFGEIEAWCDDFCKRLHSQGVVRKTSYNCEGGDETTLKFYAVEPLITEE